MRPSRPNLWNSLRVRVALVVALPIFLILGASSVIHAYREIALLGDQARINAIQLGNLMIHSLNFSMLSADGGHLVTTLDDVSKLKNIEHVKIIGMSGRVLAEDNPLVTGKVFSLDDEECWGCHKDDNSEVPQIIALENSAVSWRVSAPIDNLPECHQCHDPEMPHMGVLLMDISVDENRATLIQNVKGDLTVSVLGTLLFTVGIYFAVHWLIIRRVDAFNKPLADFANGNLATRIPETSRIRDELDEFVVTFNHMAAELEHHIQATENRHQLREQAILDERERIARELHDGLAQVLGYINTKAIAARLFLKDNKVNDVDRQLADLESAAQGLFVDIREAILGLRMSGETDNGLIPALREYASQFSKLSGIPTVMNAPELDQFNPLSPEIELHLFRIVQEALSNIRKHSVASQAWVELVDLGERIQLIVRDNGIGFDVEDYSKYAEQRFGLKTMGERASEIGANISVVAKPGAGTQILVELRYDE